MKYWIYILSCLLVLSACNKIPVGFLETENAAYLPNRIYVYHNIEEGTPQANGAPFTSTYMQGLAGTQPLIFGFHSVKASKGGDASKFLELVRTGAVLVRGGGYVQISPQAAKQLPYGEYLISIEVKNEGYSAILKDVLTFIVKEAYEDSDGGTVEDEP